MLLQKSHYRCELAIAAKAEGRIADASAQLKKALASNRGFVRANHLQAQFAASQGDYPSAVRLLRQTVEQDPAYLPEVLSELVACFRHLGDLPALRAYLQEVAANHPGMGAELALAEMVRE
jgi:lipopolysaccharide biosynthesis regulator YciM